MASPGDVRFPELGIYLLPGHTDRPADLLDEVRAAEALGLGSAWISERFDVKEVGALCGAAAAVTSRDLDRHRRHQRRHAPPAACSRASPPR